MYEYERLRTFLIVIRDSHRSSPFARTMATAALDGKVSALEAEQYWLRQIEPKRTDTKNDVQRPEDEELRRMSVAAQDEIFSWNARRWGW